MFARRLQRFADLTSSTCREATISVGSLCRFDCGDCVRLFGVTCGTT
jgi:hypothetical protein